MSIAMRVLILMLVAALTGCNTVSGLGRDIEKAGEAIQKGANK